MSQGRSLVDPRFRLRHRVLNSAAGAVYMKLRSNYAPYRVQPDTSLVIDGYPRSANTYAYFAAQSTLGVSRVKGHTHAAATVRSATRTGIPCIVIVRDPDYAVSSLVQLAEGVTVQSAFWAYVNFYQAVRSVQQDVYIASFDEVVSDFGAVMRGANRKYGTSLSVYNKTDQAEEAIRSHIEESSARKNNMQVREAGVARPSPHRIPPEVILQDLNTKGERARREARRIYREIISE